MSGGRGRRALDNQSLLSELIAYRTDSTGADVATATASATAVAALTGIGTLDLTDSHYAAEMTLNLYVSLRGSGKATIEIWTCYDPDASNQWYCVQSEEINYGGKLIQIQNAPPAYYRIVVTDLTADAISIHYQYRR